MWLGEYDRQNWYPEIQSLSRAGFDSVKYTCEVLKRIIQWEIKSKYGPDDHGISGSTESSKKLSHSRNSPLHFCGVSLRFGRGGGVVLYG